MTASADPRRGGSRSTREASVGLRLAIGLDRDDGLVGACVVIREAGIWTVPLLMMSCRAMGRGVVDALLAWLVRQAARAGARRLRISCVTNSRNVPLRLALAAAGFRVPEAAGAAGQGATGQGTAGQRTAGRGPEGGEAGGMAGGGDATSGQVPAVFERDVGTALPVLPAWVEAPGEQGGDAA